MLSDAKPFKWLKKRFGIERPKSLGYDEWTEWTNKTKADHPIVWFLGETLPEALEHAYFQAREPFYQFRVQFYHRFALKTHNIPTKLKKGDYHTFGERLLHGPFEMLVDFVECELAYDNVRWNEDKFKTLRRKYKTPLWLYRWWTRWGSWRSPEAGVDNLMYDMKLDFPENNSWIDSQAARARETFELYMWWKFIRPSRKDVFEESGMNYISQQLDEKYGEGWVFSSSVQITPEENQLYSDAGKKMDALINQQYDEDNDMLLRLLKHRDELYA